MKKALDKPIKTCSCCGQEFTLNQLIDIIKADPKPMYDEDGKPLLYLFDCECKSTLALKVEVVEVN